MEVLAALAASSEAAALIVTVNRLGQRVDAGQSDALVIGGPGRAQSTYHACWCCTTLSSLHSCGPSVPSSSAHRTVSASSSACTTSLVSLFDVMVQVEDKTVCVLIVLDDPVGAI
jgi:hypothetical protein